MSLLERAARAVSGVLGRESRLIRATRPAYEWLLDAASGGRGVLWSVNGEPIRIDPRVRHLIPRTTELELFEFLRATIRPGDVVLDVGSFLGTYAILEARWAGPSGRVIAFEPNPPSAAVLRRHLALNGCSDRVTLEAAALAAEPGEATFHVYAEPYRSSLSGADPAARSGSVTVPITTIDAVCSGHRVTPRVIRIDVQGHELETLRGGRATLSTGTTRPIVVVELHTQFWPELGITRDAFEGLVDELGFSLRPLEGTDPFLPDTHVVLEPR